MYVGYILALMSLIDNGADEEVILAVRDAVRPNLLDHSYDDRDEFIDKFNDEKYFELRCLLDTRSNDDGSKTGYQLFVSSHNDERNVYVIPRADVMGIKKLTNPAEAIDHYAAHLFSRAEGEFDFMQYAEDF